MFSLIATFFRALFDAGMMLFGSVLVSLFNKYWERASTWVIRAVLAPAAYYLFGPIFMLSVYVLGKILAYLQDAGNGVGISFVGLTAWVLGCLRFQECMAVILDFIVLGIVISIGRKLIGR